VVLPFLFSLPQFREHQVGGRALGRFRQVPEAREQLRVDQAPGVCLDQVVLRLFERGLRIFEELRERTRAETAKSFGDVGRR